jgi:uncharacterized protein YsxB (DUF464 family)
MERGLAVMAEGHANFAPRGRDIVCAGASALLYAYRAGLTALPSVKSLPLYATETVEYRRGPGKFVYTDVAQDRFLVISYGLNREDERTWQVIAEGLRLLAEAYPRNVRFLDGGRSGLASATTVEELFFEELCPVKQYEKGGECI